jgi:hypothetical protein
MIAANVRSAWPDPTAVLMQAWVPVIALWLWHTLAAGRRPRGAPFDLTAAWMRVVEPTTTSPSTGGEAEAPADATSGRAESPNRQPRIPARGEVRRLLGRRTHGSSHTDLRRLAGVVSERTGVSIPHARRLLREEQQLRIREEGEP